MTIFASADNVVFYSEEELNNSPSKADGVDAATEYELRLYGAELVADAGILLEWCAPLRALLEPQETRVAPPPTTSRCERASRVA